MEKFVVLLTITQNIEQGNGVSGLGISQAVIGPFESDEEYATWCDKFNQTAKYSPHQIKTQLMKLMGTDRNAVELIVGLQ